MENEVIYTSTENKYLTIIKRFIKTSKPNLINVGSLIIEDEIFYDLIIVYRTEITINGVTRQLDSPTYFVEFKRNHNQYQFEIKP